VQTCPAAEQLVDYWLGKLSDPELERVLAHVETCENCQATLDRLDEAPPRDWLIDDLSQPPDDVALDGQADPQAGVEGAVAVEAPSASSAGGVLPQVYDELRRLAARRLAREAPGKLLDAALKEMIRILQEEEPSRPSTRFSTDEALPSLAALRKTDPKRLMAMLGGELDWVATFLSNAAKSVFHPLDPWPNAPRQPEIAFQFSRPQFSYRPLGCHASGLRGGP